MSKPTANVVPPAAGVAWQWENRAFGGLCLIQWKVGPDGNILARKSNEFIHKTFGDWSSCWHQELAQQQWEMWAERNEHAVVQLEE